MGLHFRASYYLVSNLELSVSLSGGRRVCMTFAQPFYFS